MFVNWFISEPIRALFVQILAEKAYQKNKGAIKFFANPEVIELFKSMVSYRTARKYVIESQVK